MKLDMKMFLFSMPEIKAKVNLVHSSLSHIQEYSGTPWYVVYKGAAASHFMTRIGYNAMAIGNHEFDNGHWLITLYDSLYI